MKSRGMKQYAVMAVKPGWSKPRFVWDGPASQLLLFDNKTAATAKAGNLNRFGRGMLYPKGSKPISRVTFQVFPVWTETII